MRGLQNSPSQLLKESHFSKSPASQRKAMAMLQNKSYKDANSVPINTRKFEKLTAFTTDGNKLAFHVHLTDRAGYEKKKVRLAQHKQEPTKLITSNDYDGDYLAAGEQTFGPVKSFPPPKEE